MAFEILEIDKNNAARVELLMGNAGSVEFQFPPEIKSDNKSIAWEEKNIRNVEPVAIFGGASNRAIEMAWTYIITGGQWDIYNIAMQVKDIRGYFYQQVTSQFESTGLIIKFKAYNVAGSQNTESMTFRGESLTVAHSGPIIFDGNESYPLKTDLSVILKMTTKAETPSGEPLIEFPGLKEMKFVRGVAPEWY